MDSDERGQDTEQGTRDQGSKDGNQAGSPKAGSQDRDETEAEREDRQWDDMLQELRVMQTSAQLTAGFLLTLPFQQAFADLNATQRHVYLGLVILAAVVTALVLAPVAIHRRLAGRHVKDRLVKWAGSLMRAVLAALGVLVTGIVTFVFDVVVDDTAALVAGGSMALVLILLLLGLPQFIVEET